MEKKALAKLKKLKVYRVIDCNPNETFYDIWCMVCSECELYYDLAIDSGDISEYLECMGDHIRLDGRSYRSAVKWLRETRHLVGYEDWETVGE